MGLNGTTPSQHQVARIQRHCVCKLFSHGSRRMSLPPGTGSVGLWSQHLYTLWFKSPRNLHSWGVPGFLPQGFPATWRNNTVFQVTCPELLWKPLSSAVTLFTLIAGVSKLSSGGLVSWGVCKKDDDLHPCIYCRGLNEITVQNATPYLLRSTLFKLLQVALILIKLNKETCKWSPANWPSDISAHSILQGK